MQNEAIKDSGLFPRVRWAAANCSLWYMQADRRMIHANRHADHNTRKTGNVGELNLKNPEKCIDAAKIKVTQICKSLCLYWFTYLLAYTLGLWGSNMQRFMRWFRRCINCLFVCLLNSLHAFLLSLFSSFLLVFSLLVYFMAYLSNLTRIDPFRFRYEGRRRQPNLALVFLGLLYLVVYLVTDACLLSLCLFQFFSAKPRD